MNLFFLGWVNWRALSAINNDVFLYALLFGAIGFVAIQGFSFFYKKIKSGKNK